jgi:hypothetical protein
MEAHRVERLRGSPHFLYSRLTDGGEAVSLTRRPVALYPHEYSWYSFLLEAESTPGPWCLLEGLCQLKKKNQ